MFDDILDIASGYNLITPLASFVQDLINGPHCYFGIPVMAGWTKREIGRILTRHGVIVWGLIYYGDEVIFTVRKDQARWAYCVLAREGVPITYPTAEAVQASTRRSQRQTDAIGPLDTIFRFLDKLNEGRY